MRIFKSKWFMVMMILVIGWLALSFIKIKLHENIVNKEAEELGVKISNLEKSNSLIEKFIVYMSNPSFIERQARIKLNYKAQDEEVVFIYPDNSAKASFSSENLKNEPPPNYIKWWYYLIEN